MPWYSDNPAMKKGYTPDPKVVQSEYWAMINAFTATGKAKIFEINFPNANELDTIRKIQETQDDISRNLRQNTDFVNPNGKDLVDKEGEFTQHDFVFVRDSFISNQKDKILISNFSRPERKVEERIMKEILEMLVKKYNIERKIITAPEGLFFEGGNFRYIPEEGILFAGMQNRNNKEWINFVKEQFEIDKDKILMIDGIGFHVDTYFSAVTGNDGKLVAGIICSNLVHNMPEIRNFFKKHNKILLEVDDKFGIWENGDGTGNFSTNTLQLQEYLIGCDRFDDNTEQILERLGIVRVITPTGEYKRSWWSIHCSTNQI